MVTNKTTAVRLGYSHLWSSKSVENSWFNYHLNLRLKKFFEKFFGDKFFQNRGISFSHVLLKFFIQKLQLEVFVHDSKLQDFYASKPSHKSLRLVRSKVRKIKKFFKKFKLFKKFLHKKRKKIQLPSLKFSKASQSKFPLRSSPKLGYFRKRFQHSKFRPVHYRSSIFSSVSTAESKFKKKKNFSSLNLKMFKNSPIFLERFTQDLINQNLNFIKLLNFENLKKNF